jgi:carboxymethylenebutenolidase
MMMMAGPCSVSVTGMKCWKTSSLLLNTSSRAPIAPGKSGVVGFCFGGWISNMMAVRIPDLAAAVPFYGGQPPAESVPQINAPLLLHYAGLDTRVNEGWPAYEEALKKYKKEYTAYVYPDVNHGFHNDSTPRYDQAAAELAWQANHRFL